MRVHHLDCGSMCPAGGRLFDGTTDGVFGHIVTHCLAIETEAGLVLVDTGFGTQDVARPTDRLSPFFLALNRPRFRHGDTAVAQLARLGFKASDVRHIVLSHLDFDHAGGLEDFPGATVHVTALEKQVADARKGGAFVGTRRYRPRQWDDVNSWQLHPMGGGERWFGFDAVRDLPGLPPEILLVPLPGHTWGHSGVAVREPGGRWLLHAGDAYFHRGEIGTPHCCPPGMRGYQTMMEVDREARLANQDRLRALHADHGADVRIICGHDPVEFALMAAQGHTGE